VKIDLHHRGKVDAQHPWPEPTDEEESYLQGGGRGLVFAGKDTYTTAFVEAFVAGTFIRGEGSTIELAEDAAWTKYQTLVGCPAHPDHGPFERRSYTNGAGYCTQCGTWFSGVFEPMPEDPNREPSTMEKFFQKLIDAKDDEK